MATAFGALFILARPVSLAALTTWLIMALLFRYSSLAAVTAGILTPAYMFWWTPVWEYTAVAFMLSALLIWRHRSNIHNLLAGEEDKIGQT